MLTNNIVYMHATIVNESEETADISLETFNVDFLKH